MSNYVAETILSQIGGNRFRAMTGAKNLIAHNDGLSFRFPQTKGVNYCKITLNMFDTYDVEFGMVRNKQGVPTYTKKKVVDNIFNDQLQEVFTNTTGLYTSL